MNSSDERKLKRYNEAYDEMEYVRKRMEDERRKYEYEFHLKQQQELLEKQMVEALEEFNLPKSQYLMKRIADVMLHGINSGHNNLTPRDTIPMILSEYSDEMHGFKKYVKKVQFDHAIKQLIEEE